jgi:hypothetical protein
MYRREITACCGLHRAHCHTADRNHVAALRADCLTCGDHSRNEVIGDSFMTAATTTKPTTSSQTNAPGQPQSVTAPFSVCFVGGGSAYRSAGLCIVAPMGAVPEPSNTLEAAAVSADSEKEVQVALWVLGSDNRIYPYVNGAPNFACCWDLPAAVQNGVQVCLDEPNTGATSQKWTFNWTNYTITNAAAGGYFLDSSWPPRPGGKINLFNPGSPNPNSNELWNLQLAPQRIPPSNSGSGSLAVSPPVTLMFGSVDRDASWGMNPVAGVNTIEQCTVVLSQNMHGSPVQYWVFGSDERIYPYVNRAAVTTYCLDLDPYYAPALGNGTPLVLNLVIPNQSTQQWKWHPNQGAISNKGAPGYFVDLAGGSMNPGSKIQIWNPSSSTPNNNEIWIPEIVLTGT